MSSWWDNVADLVERARALPESEREAYLAEACGGDAALLRDVQMVLGSEAPDEFLEPAEHVLPAGHVLGGFTLLRPVGRGGMGVVYLARQAGLREAAALEERLAAVKVFPRTREAEPQGYERFLREAEAATSLQHAGLVGVLASGQTDGVAWYAMPYIDGHDLHVELERQRKLVAGAEAGGPLILPPFGSERYLTAVLEAMANVADAVDHVHRRQVIHRDIKPRNLLLDRAGNIRIADFGLAKILSLDSLTLTGQHLGTPYYMSPEQARAINNPVDERTDIYSMGVVLFEMLSLKNHVRGRSAQEIIRRIASGETLRLEREAPRTPRDLVTICEQALAVRPSDRYRTASAFAADLRHVLHREAIDARPRTRWQRSRDWTLRHPVLMVASALILLGLLGGSLWSSHRAEQQRIGDWKSRLDAALVLPDWRGSESVAADARAAVEGLRARGDVPRVLGELVGQFEARLQRDRVERIATARALREHGQGGPIPGTGVDPYLAPPSGKSIVDSAIEASTGLTVHAGDPLLESMTLFGTDISIDLDPNFAPHAQAAGPARAFAYSLDPVIEEYAPRLDLGALPVRAQLAPGDWRFVVELPGVGFTEYDREYVLGERAEPIVARVHLEADVQRGCVLLPSVTLTLDDPRELGCTLTRREVGVAAVWVSEASVSNGEYLEFLGDTGHKAPFGWINVGYPDAQDTDHSVEWQRLPGVNADPRFLELPATGMSYRDMQSYAEWAGMRLPTHHEMEYALRGAGMSRTPPAGAHIGGEPLIQGAGNTRRFTHYVERAAPVRSGTRLAPHGLFHIYGNVHEMTSGKVTIDVPPTRQLVVLAGERIHMGASWSAERTDDPIYNHWITKTENQLNRVDVGFRCVRSAASQDS